MARGFSPGEARMEMAEFARDAKRERGMCAHGGCTRSWNLKEGPKGYRGQYGGNMLCPEHYEKVVDNLTESLIENGCAPWE